MGAEKGVSTYNIALTRKKVISTAVITIISTLITYGVAYLTKFKITIPEELKTEFVILSIIFLNGSISGIRNWFKHRKGVKVDEKDGSIGVAIDEVVEAIDNETDRLMKDLDEKKDSSKKE